MRKQLPTLFATLSLLFAFGLSASSAATGRHAHLMCDPPILLTYSNPTTTTVNLSWVPVGAEMEWEVAVVPLGSPTPGAPTAPSVFTTSYQHGGLSPGVAYEFYIRAVCGGTPGNWAKYNGFFVTDLANPSNCSSALPLPDANCLEFEIEVNAAPGTQLGGDVYLQAVRFIIQHEWADDLDIRLESPAGVKVALSTDNGGSDDNYGDPDDPLCQAYTELLSEQAPGACNVPMISLAEAPFIGSFLPEENMGLFNDGSSPLGLWTLEICDDALDDLGQLEYVELVFAPLACNAPSDLTVVSFDSTSITLDWLPGENCTNTLIEFGPAGYAPGSDGQPGAGGLLVMTACPPVVIQGLDPETAYDFYVRELCIAGGYSNNTCPAQVLTPCSPPPPTILEDFNDDALCSSTCDAVCPLSGPWYNGSIDPLNWLVFAGSTPTAGTGPDDDFPGGGQYVYLESSGACPTNGQAILYSHCIEVNAPAGDTCHFSFDYLMFGNTVNDLKLEVTINGGQNWNLLWQKTGNQGAGWRHKYIDLSAYDGMLVQFRFVGRKGITSRSDLALDNLVFYGSVDQGFPSNVYYADVDGDQYGNPNQYVATCSLTPPPGFVGNNGDCFDLDPQINPGVPESPCDGLDINCNGMVDENFLPPPVVTPDTVCSGQFALLEAEANYGGILIWYDSAVGGQPLDTGFSFVPVPALQNNSPDPVNFFFYVEEVNDEGCYSPVRAQVAVRVNPQPDLFIPPGQLEAGCSGEQIDLGSVVVQDLHNTNATLSYHSAFPPTPGNELPSTLVSPTQTTTYYLQAVSDGGCVGYDSVVVSVLPSPGVEITGDSLLCLGEGQFLAAQPTGAGTLPYLYSWNTLVNGPNILVIGSGAPGSSAVYSVTLTDANQCTGVDSFTVTTIASISSVQVNVVDVSACGGNNGLIQLNPLGGQGPFTYEWKGPLSGSDQDAGGVFAISGLEQGSYSITITDSSTEACPFVLPVVIVNGPTANVEIGSIEHVSCAGSQDGCIHLDISGGNPTILWSTQDTTASLCGLSGGLYSVTVTDGACENVLTDILVQEPDSLAVKTTVVTDVSCFGGNDGAISILVGGGTSPYFFQWSNGLTSQNLQNLEADYYSLTITDSKGCALLLDSVLVDEPAPLQLLQIVDSISCFGLTDGAIAVSPIGGTPPYAFSWNTGSNLDFIEGLGPGAYDLVVVDGQGCTHVENFLLTEPDSLTLEQVLVTNASCNGVPDGSLEVVIGGGTLPYSYSWNTGDMTALAMDLEPGFYAVTVTDARGCILKSPPLEVGAPDLITVNAIVTPSSCLGFGDGAIQLQPLTGQQPFDYEWDTGDSTGSLQDLSPGIYFCTITDAAGCTDTLSVEVGFDQPISVTTSAFPPNCFGGENGQIFLTAMGGTPQYQFAWSNGDTTDDIEDLAAGPYICTITDASGCFLVTDTIDLIDPPQIVVEVLSVDPVICNGAADGGIDVQVSGGVGPYQFTWNDEVTTEDRLQIPGGTYILTVEDALNCAIDSDPIVVPEPAPLEVELVYIDNLITCDGNTVDSLMLDISGGTPPYAIEWSNGNTTPYLDGMATGEYTVAVVDVNGCRVLLEEIKVPEPTEPIALMRDEEFVFPDSCENLGEGAGIQVLIQGGAAPYQYNWSNGVAGMTSSDTLQQTGINPGYYHLTVTDDYGCVAELDSLQVVLPTQVGIQTPSGSIHHVSCKGGMDGSITIQLSGGTAPFTYIWTNLQGDTVSTEAVADSLPAGTYAVKVVDQIGCTAFKGNLKVNEPATSMQVTYQVTNNLCYGGTSGLINLNVMGGTLPYSFLWNNDATLEDLFNLPAGNYAVTVTDHNGCTFTLDSIPLTQPLDSLHVSAFEVGQISCFGAKDGYIDLTVTGGTPQYNYIWSNNKFTQDIQNLGPGAYSCFISDAFGCQYQTMNFIIVEPSQIEVADFEITPSGVGTANGVIEVTISGGIPFYTYQWSNGDTGPVADSLTAGEYSLQVYDFNGCLMTFEFVVPDKPVGTLDPSLPLWARLYPNPTAGPAWLELQFRAPADLRLTVTDALGRERWSKELPNFAAGQIELPELGSGIFWVQVWREGKVVYRNGLVVE